MKVTLNTIRIKALSKRNITMENLAILMVLDRPRTRGEIADMARTKPWKVTYFLKKHANLVDRVDQEGNKYKKGQKRPYRLLYVRTYHATQIIKKLNKP